MESKENNLKEKNGFLKKAILHGKSILYIVISLFAGFYSGKLVVNYNQAIKPKHEFINDYNKVYSSGEISIAVNESNQLILIERKSGRYKVYSDLIGKSIFNMYIDRINKTINDGK